MDLKKLREILNLNLTDDVKKHLIIDVLAKDNDIVLTLMEVIHKQRIFNKEMQGEMNLLLSKAHVGLNDVTLNKNGFIQEEINEFYKKYSGHIGHCFMEDLE